MNRGIEAGIYREKDKGQEEREHQRDKLQKFNLPKNFV